MTAARPDPVGGLAGRRANPVAMQDLTAKRTLVKSQPELWEELSELERLAKHLGAFGEIKITKLEPEHTVAWEGKRACGTVSIEPSGWGTKVTLTAELVEDGDPPEQEEPVGAAGVGEEPAPDAGDAAADAVEQPVDVTKPAPADEVPSTVQQRRRRGFWSRLFAGWLVPEERLARATVTDTAEPPGAGLPGTPAQTRVEEEPPRTVEAAAGVVAEETPAPDVGPDGHELAAPTTDTEVRAAIDHEQARSVLEETLDALGSAHHRPFSRG
jgi:hypothetical protein